MTGNTGDQGVILAKIGLNEGIYADLIYQGRSLLTNFSSLHQIGLRSLDTIDLSTGLLVGGSMQISEKDR